MDFNYLTPDKYAAALSMHVTDAKEISLTVMEKFTGSAQSFRLRYREGPLYDSYVRFFDLDPAPSRPASFRGDRIVCTCMTLGRLDLSRMIATDMNALEKLR